MWTSDNEKDSNYEYHKYSADDSKYDNKGSDEEDKEKFSLLQKILYVILALFSAYLMWSRGIIVTIIILVIGILLAVKGNNRVARNIGKALLVGLLTMTTLAFIVAFIAAK